MQVEWNYKPSAPLRRTLLLQHIYDKRLSLDRLTRGLWRNCPDSFLAIGAGPQLEIDYERRPSGPITFDSVTPFSLPLCKPRFEGEVHFESVKAWGSEGEPHRGRGEREELGNMFNLARGATVPLGRLVQRSVFAMMSLPHVPASCDRGSEAGRHTHTRFSS